MGRAPAESPTISAPYVKTVVSCARPIMRHGKHHLGPLLPVVSYSVLVTPPMGSRMVRSRVHVAPVVATGAASYVKTVVSSVTLAGYATVFRMMVSTGPRG